MTDETTASLVGRLRESAALHDQGPFRRDIREEAADALEAQAVRIAELEAEKDGEKSKIQEVIAEDGGYWNSCTGCHETNEGQETGWYPYSDTYCCYVGGGCRECGGIGVIWDNTDWADFAEFSIEQDSLEKQRDTALAEVASMRDLLERCGQVLPRVYSSLNAEIQAALTKSEGVKP